MFSDIATQLPLLELTPVIKGNRSHEEWVKDFMQQNPSVENLLLALAKKKVENGASRISMKLLWEQLRETGRIQTGETPNLNNNLTADYARLLTKKHPELFAGVFLFRKRKLKGVPLHV